MRPPHVLTSYFRASLTNAPSRRLRSLSGATRSGWALRYVPSPEQVTHAPKGSLKVNMPWCMRPATTRTDEPPSLL